MNITKSEMAKLFTIISLEYPKFDVSELRLEMWHHMLGGYSYNVLQAAVKKVIYTSNFVPTIAAINKEVIEIINYGNKDLEAGEAFKEVMQAIRKYGFYGQEEAYKMLSPLTLKVVKQIGWRETCYSEKIDVVRGQFLRLYDNAKEKEENEKLLPQEYLDEIKEISKKFLEIDGDIKIKGEIQSDGEKSKGAV